MNFDKDVPEDIQKSVQILLADLNLSPDEKLTKVKALGLVKLYLDRARNILATQVNSDDEQWEKIDLLTCNTPEKIILTSGKNEMDKFIRIHHYESTELHVEFPVLEELSKQKLCQAFKRTNDENCHIFYQYRHLLSLDSINSYCTLKEDGDYTIVFESDKMNFSSMKLVGIQLKVSDGLYPDLTTAVRKELLSIIEDKEHVNIETYFQYNRWKMIAKWAVTQSIEVQELLRAFLIGKVDQELLETLASSAGVSPALSSPYSKTVLVDEPDTNQNIISKACHTSEQENQKEQNLMENKMQFSLDNWTLQENSIEQISAVSTQLPDPVNDLFISPNTTSSVISSKDTFLNLLSANLRSAMLTLIDLKEWSAIKIILKDKSNEIKDAFQVFMENYKSQHPNEFPIAELLIFDEPRTIVLFGETGVGKSTFINSLINYLRYETMHKAKEKGPEIAITTKFVHLDEDLNPVEIKCIRTVDIDEEDNKIFNEEHSVAQHPKAYLFQFGPDPRQSIRIIDTTGANSPEDLCGMEQESKKFTNTLRFLAGYKKIDAFLILMKPNMPRLTPMLKYYISELFTHLHHSASQNILFCFTNSRPNQYNPGATLPALQKFLNELYAKKSIKIPIEEDTVFFYDNESFPILCAWWKEARIDETEIEELSTTWKYSVKETFRLMNKVKQLNAYHTENNKIQRLQLENNGKNFCFMNSVIQCFTNSSYLDVILQDNDSIDLPFMEPFRKVQEIVSSRTGRNNVRSLARSMKAYGLPYNDHSQHDCADFLNDLLEYFSDTSKEKISHTIETKHQCINPECLKVFNEHQHKDRFIFTVTIDSDTNLKRLIDSLENDGSLPEIKCPDCGKNEIINLRIPIFDSESSSFVIDIQKYEGLRTPDLKYSDGDFDISGVSWTLRTIVNYHGNGNCGHYSVYARQGRTKNFDYISDTYINDCGTQVPLSDAKLLWFDRVSPPQKLPQAVSVSTSMEKSSCYQNTIPNEPEILQQGNQEITKWKTVANEPIHPELIKNEAQLPLEKLPIQENSIKQIPSANIQSPKPKDVLSDKPDEIKTVFQGFLENQKNKHSDEGPETLPFMASSTPEPVQPQQPERYTNLRKLNPDYFDFKEPLTIVLFGETGAGKSTFINFLANYLLYETMNEAKEKGPEILITTKFVHYDDEMNAIEIECTPTIDIHEEDKLNELVTDVAKIYLFQLGPEPRQSIKIIDTPGFGNCRGMQQDRANFTNTLRFLADYEKISAFLVFLEPNGARLTVEFKYGFLELLTHLHHSATQNILFCFTKCRGNFYRPGDKFSALREYLNGLYANRKIRIPLERNTIFCFDSESFNFLCAWRKKVSFDEYWIKNCAASWIRADCETFRLIDKIKKLAPYRTEDTLNINNIRSLIFTFARPLAKLGQVLETNIELIKEKSADITAQEAKVLRLEKTPAVLELLLPHAKELEHPITVCTSEKCIEIRSYQLANGSKTSVTNDKTKCHSPKCNCISGISVEVEPNELVKSCICFKKYGINQCSHCGCPWNTHMHIRYELVEERQQVDNTQRDQELAQCKNELARKKVLLRDLERRKTNMENDFATIKNCYKELVTFLRKNSILPYNHGLREYILQLIREEEIKVRQGESNHVLNELRNSLKVYDEQVKMFEELPENHPSNKTIEQILDMIQDIKNLPNCKDLLSAVEALEWMSVRREQTNRITKVAMENGWVYRQMTGNKSY